MGFDTQPGAGGLSGGRGTSGDFSQGVLSVMGNVREIIWGIVRGGICQGEFMGEIVRKTALGDVRGISVGDFPGGNVRSKVNTHADRHMKTAFDRLYY